MPKVDFGQPGRRDTRVPSPGAPALVDPGQDNPIWRGVSDVAGAIRDVGREIGRQDEREELMRRRLDAADDTQAALDADTAAQRGLQEIVQDELFENPSASHPQAMEARSAQIEDLRQQIRDRYFGTDRDVRNARIENRFESRSNAALDKIGITSLDRQVARAKSSLAATYAQSLNEIVTDVSLTELQREERQALVFALIDDSYGADIISEAQAVDYKIGFNNTVAEELARRENHRVEALRAGNGLIHEERTEGFVRDVDFDEDMPPQEVQMRGLGIIGDGRRQVALGLMDPQHASDQEEAVRNSMAKRGAELTTEAQAEVEGALTRQIDERTALMIRSALDPELPISVLAAEVAGFEAQAELLGDEYPALRDHLRKQVDRVLLAGKQRRIAAGIEERRVATAQETEIRERAKQERLGLLIDDENGIRQLIGNPNIPPDVVQRVMERYEAQLERFVDRGDIDAPEMKKRRDDMALAADRARVARLLWSDPETLVRTMLGHPGGEPQPWTPTGVYTEDGRPILFNDEGGLSTEQSITVEHPRAPGKYINIPTIFNGQKISDEGALRTVIQSGFVDPVTGREVTAFDSKDSAVTAAQERSEALAFDPGMERANTLMREHGAAYTLPTITGKEREGLIAQAQNILDTMGAEGSRARRKEFDERWKDHISDIKIHGLPQGMGISPLREMARLGIYTDDEIARMQVEEVATLKFEQATSLMEGAHMGAFDQILAMIYPERGLEHPTKLALYREAEAFADSERELRAKNSAQYAIREIGPEAELTAENQQAWPEIIDQRIKVMRAGGVQAQNIRILSDAEASKWAGGWRASLNADDKIGMSRLWLQNFREHYPTALAEMAKHGDLPAEAEWMGDVNESVARKLANLSTATTAEIRGGLTNPRDDGRDVEEAVNEMFVDFSNSLPPELSVPGQRARYKETYLKLATAAMVDGMDSEKAAEWAYQRLFDDQYVFHGQGSDHALALPRQFEARSSVILGHMEGVQANIEIYDPIMAGPVEGLTAEQAQKRWKAEIVSEGHWVAHGNQQEATLHHPVSGPVMDTTGNPITIRYDGWNWKTHPAAEVPLEGLVPIPPLPPGASEAALRERRIMEATIRRQNVPPRFPSAVRIQPR